MFCFILFCLSSSVQFNPVQSIPVLSCPVLSCPVLFCSVLSSPVLSCPILSYPVKSSQVQSSPVHFYPFQSCPAPSRLVLSGFITFCLRFDLNIRPTGFDPPARYLETNAILYELPDVRLATERQRNPEAIDTLINSLYLHLYYLSLSAVHRPII